MSNQTPDDEDTPSNSSSCSSAFPVGEYVADELEERGWTHAEAVARLPGGYTELNHCWLELICCVPAWFKHDIQFSQEEAERLEGIFGVSAQTWMNLDASFRRAKTLFSN